MVIKRGVSSIPVKGVKAESAVTQSLLREATQKKIAYLLSKHAIKDVEVYVIIKDFFKEYLHEHYEFTFDELAKELNKTYIEKHVKEALYRLLEDFSTIEYKDEEIPQNVLHDVLRTFSKVVDDLIKQQSTKKGFFDRLFSKNDGLPEKPQEQTGEKSPPPVPSIEQSGASAKTAGQGEKVVVADNKKEALPKADSKGDEESQDGFQVPSLSQDGPGSPPTDFGEDAVEQSPQEERVPNAPEQADQTSAFTEETLPKRSPANSNGSGWTETVEEVPQAKEALGVDDEFPFATENEELGQPGAVQKKDNELSRRVAAPVQEEKPVEEPEVVASVAEQPPVKEEPASSPVRHHKAAPKRTKAEVYFGSEEEELSADLNKLAEELDEVIRNDEVKPQAKAVMRADDLNQLITETDRLITEKRFDEALNTYKELVGRYHGLPEEKKHEHYDEVQHLYELLQHH